MPVRDLHSPTKPHPCPHPEMPGALKGPRWPRWEHCPGHRSFPTKPSRLSRPKDILTCGWGMHTCTHTSPGSVARSRACAGTVRQGGRQRRSTRPAALTVRRAPRSGTMAEPRPRRWLGFACCLLHREDGRAGELLMAPARLRVTAVVPTGWAHGCEERNYFFKGRKIPNGPFGASVHIIVVSKLMKGLACWLAEYPLMPPPAPHVERLRHRRGTQTPVGRWERAGREVGKA